MDIWEVDKLALFVAFVIPGFVSLKAYEILFLSSPKETSTQLIDAVTYSCLNYAILFPAVFYVEGGNFKESSPIAYALFYLFVFFIAPIIWVCCLKWLRGSKILQKWLPHPTERPWDYVFGARTPYWVIVTLKNGRQIAGTYGFNSFSSSGATRAQLYIEQTWELNDEGGFERIRSDSAGTLIVCAEIESIELFQWKYGESDEQKTN